MTEEFPYESPDPSRIIYQDISIDGRLTISVMRDDEPETLVMKEFGGMGTVRVYDTYTGELYHEERMALSRSAIYGPGPIPEEVEHWSNIVALFTEE